MPPFDHDCIDPTADAVEAKLLEAVGTANKRCRIGKLEPDRADYRRLLDAEFPRPEGVGMWLADRGQVQSYPGSIRATLLGLAWWTSPLGRKHVKIVGRRIEPFNTSPTNRFGPPGTTWPALCYLDPRVVARTFAGGPAEAVAICACGAVGPAASIGWMGGMCGPCHDHAEEHGTPLPSALGPATLAMDGPCQHVAFSSSGKTLVGVSYGRFAEQSSEGAVAFWDAGSGTKRKEHPQEAYLGNAVIPFVATGRRVLVEGYEESALFDQESGKRADDGSSHGLISPAAHPDGRTLAGFERDVGIVTREIEPGCEWTLAFTTASEAGEPTALAFSPDGDWLAVGRSSGHIHLHSWPGGVRQQLATPDPSEHQAVHALAFSPDGRYLAAGLGAYLSMDDSDLEFTAQPPPNGEVVLFDLKMIKARARFGGLDANVRSIAFAPDGVHAFAGDENGTIWVADASTGKQVASLGGHIALASGLAFSPDGATLASAGYEGVIRLWPWRSLLERPRKKGK